MQACSTATKRRGSDQSPELRFLLYPAIQKPPQGAAGPRGLLTVLHTTESWLRAPQAHFPKGLHAMLDAEPAISQNSAPPPESKHPCCSRCCGHRDTVSPGPQVAGRTTGAESKYTHDHRTPWRQEGGTGAGMSQVGRVQHEDPTGLAGWQKLCAPGDQMSAECPPPARLWHHGQPGCIAPGSPRHGAGGSRLPR